MMGHIFDLLFTFSSHQGKVTNIPSAHISNTYIHIFCSPYWLFLPYQFWKKIQIYQVGFLLVWVLVLILILIFQIFGDEPWLGGTSLGPKTGTSVGWGGGGLAKFLPDGGPPRKKTLLAHVQQCQNLSNALWWHQMTFGTYFITPRALNHEDIDGTACSHELFYVSPFDLLTKCNF